MDILDIPLAKITEEYLAVIESMKELNLDVAGDFLVMAAQLAHMKSRMLLPKEEQPTLDLPEEDPREVLMRRLLEYQRFKEAAHQLNELPQLGRDIFSSSLSCLRIRHCCATASRSICGLEPVETFALIRLFSIMMKKAEKRIVHEVLVERISVGARINEMVEWIHEVKPEKPVSFVEILTRFGGTVKRHVVVSFLALLEMTRLKWIRISQDDTLMIYIEPVWENLLVSEVLEEGLKTVDEFDNAAAQQSKSMT
jgi:segregation and condensation protein A